MLEDLLKDVLIVYIVNKKIVVFQDSVDKIDIITMIEKRRWQWLGNI